MHVAEDRDDQEHSWKVPSPSGSDIGAYPHAAFALATDMAGKCDGAVSVAGRTTTGDGDPKTSFTEHASCSRLVACPVPTLYAPAVPADSALTKHRATSRTWTKSAVERPPLRTSMG